MYNDLYNIAKIVLQLVHEIITRNEPQFLE